MLYLYAASQFSHTVEHTLVDLKPLIKQYCGRSFRRIDRFIELALLGAGQCTQQISLSADTRLMLCSDQGAISNPINTLHQLFDQHTAPMPFSFINTLGNSACFYIAQHLGLKSGALCVSRGQQSFEAGLQLAELELTAMHTQARMLIGAVDECPPPAAEQRQRLGLAACAAVAESSHWVLVGRHNDGHAIAELELSEEYEELPALLRWCKRFPEHIITSNMAVEASELQSQPFQPAAGYNPSQSAEAIIGLKQGIWLSQTAEGSWLGVRVTPSQSA